MKHHFNFVKQVVTMGLLDILGVVQTLVFLPLITKLLGAGDFGIWSQVKITMSLLVSFSFLGLHEALVRFIPGSKNDDEIKEGVYSSLAVVLLCSMFIAGLLALFSGYAADVLNFKEPFVMILSLIIIFEAVNTIFLVIVRAIREIEKYFLFAVSRIMGEIFLVALAIVFGWGIFGAILALLGVRILLCASLFAYLMARIGIKIPDFTLLKKYLSFSLPTMLDGFSYWIITSSDRYLIGFFLGIVFVGYYAPAYSLAYMISFLIFPLSSMLSVVLPKLFDQDDIEGVKKYLSHSFKLFLFFAIPITFGMTALAKPLLAFLSNEEIARNAYLVVPLVAFSILWYGASYFFSQILVLVKKTKLIASIWAIGALINIFLNMVFIPLFGLIAAGGATLCSYIVAFLLLRYFSKKYLEFRVDLMFILKCSLASLVMFFAITMIPLEGFLRIASSAILGFALYIILMLLLNGVQKHEIEFFKKSITFAFNPKL